MKKIILLTLFTFSVAFGQVESFSFNGHRFLYNLADAWGAPLKSQKEGFLDASFKRAVIFDSKRTKVVPNLLIKLIKLNVNKEKDSLDESKMFTITSIMHYAPPEVLTDYKKSINISSVYGLNCKNSYGFDSPYVDGSGARHTCLYFTIFDRRSFGVFICIDATEEVFAIFKPEVNAFLASIKLK